MEIANSRRREGASAFLGGGDPTRPVLTYYDDATGERTELSAVTLGNWVAKTANLLAEECGLGPGDRAAVLLPPHWQTAAVLLGIWTAGLDLAGDGRCDAAFVALDRLEQLPENVSSAEHRFVLGLAPMGARLPEVPAGWQDYAADVLAQGDQLPPYLPAGEPPVAAARAAASEMGIQAGDRLLVDAAAHDDPARWLLAPLVAGASIVLCAHLDPGAVEDRTRVEKVTRVL